MIIGGAGCFCDEVVNMLNAACLAFSNHLFAELFDKFDIVAIDTSCWGLCMVV